MRIFDELRIPMTALSAALGRLEASLPSPYSLCVEFEGMSPLFLKDLEIKDLGDFVAFRPNPPGTPHPNTRPYRVQAKASLVFKANVIYDETKESVEQKEARLKREGA
jgi:hypothetical protein